MIKVRFAPSPTGFLHIGSARTALFNWMYAKVQKGRFVLRIEDTDRDRCKKEFLDEILDSMTWLGLTWDEIYHQSKRFDIYKKYAAQLLDEDKAYKDGDAVILKMPQKEIKLYDIIRGEITFDTAVLKDQVLLKSDGSPAYSFACVVDDALMDITTVIRGEDHISNTPKQMMIYEALNWTIPKYAHLPLIMGPDGGRLSKRTGAAAVSDYRASGFLPEAVVNYLMLLGWSPGANQEIVSLDSAVKKFSIKKVNKAAAVFSLDKLTWVNTQHIRQKSVLELSDLLIPLLQKKGWIDETCPREKVEKATGLYKGRLATLNDFLSWAEFLFVEDVKIVPEDRKKFFKKDMSKAFDLLARHLQDLKAGEPGAFEKIFRGVVAELGLSASDLVHPVRVVLTGQSVGPGLFETMAVLGKEKTIRRLRGLKRIFGDKT